MNIGGNSQQHYMNHVTKTHVTLHLFLPHSTNESYTVFKFVRAILCMFWFLPQSFRHIILSIKTLP